MNAPQLKRLSMFTMVASLIAAAVLAILAVLFGSFNEIFVKALLTLGLVTLHALISLGFVEQTQKNQASNLSFFNNTVFVIIVLSFFTSIFGVWSVLGGEIVGKLYLTYFILVFASLHGEMLAQTLGKEKLIDRLVYANYAFMAIVVILLLLPIWLSDIKFGDFYYRLLAASGIVDATLTILAVIMHRLYIQKHPKESSKLYTIVTKMDENGNPVKVQEEVTKKPRRMHPLLWVLIILLGLQIIGSLLFGFFGAFL